MTTLPSFLLCALLLSIVLTVINGCETSLNQKNYLECRQMLEKDRQRVRAGIDLVTIHSHSKNAELQHVFKRMQINPLNIFQRNQ